MPRPPSNLARGSQVPLRKRKRAEEWRALFSSKLAAPALSLRQLARDAQLSHNAAAKRWKRLEEHRAAGCTAAEALARACVDERGGHNRVFNAEQERLLAELIRAASPAMTHTQIRDEALKLHTAVHTAQHQTRSVPSPLGTFHASSSFVTRVKRQHSLSSHRTAVISTPRPKADAPDADTVALNYVTEVHSALEVYGAERVFNMDETPISKIDPPTTAVIAKGSGHAAHVNTHISSPGQQITTLPCISAAGEKLQLCAVLKGKTPRCLKKITEGASPALQRVRLYYSEKGWVNEAILCRWMRDVLLPHTGGAPAALLLDSYAAHWTPLVQWTAATLNIELIQVPAGTTASLQPLDVQFNSTLLNARKKIWRARKQQDAWAEDTPQAAVDRQVQAYQQRSKGEVLAAFRKAHLLHAE